MKLFKKNQVYEDTSYMVVEGKEEKLPFYKQYKNLLILIGIIMVITVVIIIVINNNKNKKCNSIEDKIVDAAYAFLEANEQLPTIEGESAIVDVNDLYDENKLNEEELTLKENVCTGTVKITKYKNDYIKTFDLTNCSYCTTESRYSSWSKEISKKPNKRLLDVVAYYNYYEIETYNTKWTKFFPSSEISTELSEFDNYLPLKETDLPDIPEKGFIHNIEQETKEYYRYRDKQWKFFKDNGGSYSGLSSVALDGYPNKDTNTEMTTEWSVWSQEYPEVQSYRTIKTAKGYQWYYENKKGDKVYYNNGEYLTEAPDTQYTTKSKQSVNMYSYQDKIWRWYNGNKRTYSSFASVMPRGYSYRDDEITRYTSWTSYKDVSYLTADNSSYREQEIDIYSRYRTKYDIASYIVLDEALTKDAFEKKLERSLEEIFNDESIRVEVTYKFMYRK